MECRADFYLKQVQLNESSIVKRSTFCKSQLLFHLLHHREIIKTFTLK